MDELAKAQNALANAQKSNAPEDEIRYLELYVAELQSAKKDGKNANVTVEGISPELINLMYGAAPGAVLGQPVGKFIEDVFEGKKQAAQIRQNVVPEIPANAQGVPKSRVDRILYGTLEDGSSSLARQEGQHILQQQLAERAKEGQQTVQQLAKQGIRGIDPNIIAKSSNLVPTNRGILTTVEQAEALEKPGTSLSSKAKSIGTGAKDLLKGIQYASNKGWGPVIGRTLGGVGVGTGLIDAINRRKSGDIGGAIISGAGALGSGLSFVPGLGLIGAGLGIGAPALNYLLDENAKGNFGQGTQQSYQNMNPAGDVYATGGLVHLADGGLPDVNVSGQSIPSMSGKMPGVGYMPAPQGAMLRMQLEQELANRAKLRAAATGTGAAIPGQQSIKMMPGNVETGINIPVGSGNVDISGFRSINPMNTPISSGHMYGGNVRYTLPFKKGGKV
jgi:hypothetical protein